MVLCFIHTKSIVTGKQGKRYCELNIIDFFSLIFYILQITMAEKIPTSPDSDYSSSEVFTVHESDVEVAAPVRLLSSLKGVPASLAAERRQNAQEIARLTYQAVQANKAIEALKIDGLTGLPNRTRFNEEYPLLFMRGNVTLLFIDVRGLKQVNDEISPAEGDIYLQTVARLITETKRAEDRAYRVGGDEFILLARTDSEEDTASFAQRMWADLEDSLTREYRLPEGFDTGVYVGGASKRPDDMPADLQERAGVACSMAKRQSKA